MEKVTFINKIYSKKTIRRIEKKINLLGKNKNPFINWFLNLRLVIEIVLFFLFLFLFKNGIFLSFLVLPLFHFGFEFLFLDYPIKRRTKRLEKEALFFFESVELVLESGKTLSKAITISTKNVQGELSLEFTKVLNEMKMGKSLIESLKECSKKVPSESIRYTILTIIEASTFGWDILETLNHQLENLRNKKLMDVKNKLNLLPIKISMSIAVFFIPFLLFILVSFLISFLK